MNIGEKIKKCRIEKGWSQRELSKRMGYSNHSTITKIESGAVDIPQSKIVKFAEILDTTVAYLMDWSDPKEKTDDNDGLSDNKIKLLDFARSVPEDKAELVLRVLKSIVEDN